MRIVMVAKKDRGGECLGWMECGQWSVQDPRSSCQSGLVFPCMVGYMENYSRQMVHHTPPPSALSAMVRITAINLNSKSTTKIAKSCSALIITHTTQK